ncbi:MAG: hypothetical protein VX836_06070 [Pseudomonadota bacterium]|jgi:hypothetical protein|nr:hypothetical protein [Pseudomonadota bacterium]
MCKAMMGIAMLLVALAAHGQQRIVCWTDEQGQRACGDRVPPKYARSERQIYDQRGLVVEVKAREKTPEELAEEDRLAKLAAEKQAREQEQARYDGYLLQAYQSVAGIIDTRDSRVRVLNGRLGLTEKSIADAERALIDLRKRADNLDDQDKPVPAKLETQIADFETTLQRNRDSAARIRAERSQIVEQFAQDIARYRELRNLPVEDIPPAPMPAPLPTGKPE